MTVKRRTQKSDPARPQISALPKPAQDPNPQPEVDPDAGARALVERYATPAPRKGGRPRLEEDVKKKNISIGCNFFFRKLILAMAVARQTDKSSVTRQAVYDQILREGDEKRRQGKRVHKSFDEEGQTIYLPSWVDRKAFFMAFTDGTNLENQHNEGVVPKALRAGRSKKTPAKPSAPQTGAPAKPRKAKTAPKDKRVPAWKVP